MSIADLKLKEGGSMIAKHFEGVGSSDTGGPVDVRSFRRTEQRGLHRGAETEDESPL